MGSTAAPSAAATLEDEFVVPVELDKCDLEIFGARRCCGCESGPCGCCRGRAE